MSTSRRDLLGAVGVLSGGSLAGCSTVLTNRTDPPGTGPTSTEPPSGTGDGLPPGVGRRTVESPWDLASTHHATLVERSFTLETVASRLGYAPTGALEYAGQRTAIVQVSPSASSVSGRYRRSDPVEHHSGSFPFDFDEPTDWYADGDTASYRYHEDGESTVEEYPGKHDASRYTLRAHLEVGLIDATVRTVERAEDGTLRRVLVEDAQDPATLSLSEHLVGFRTAAEVGPGGVVVETRSEYLREPSASAAGEPSADAARERLLVHHRFVDVGTTDPEAPGWVDGV